MASQNNNSYPQTASAAPTLTVPPPAYQPAPGLASPFSPNSDPSPPYSYTTIRQPSISAERSELPTKFPRNPPEPTRCYYASPYERPSRRIIVFFLFTISSVIICSFAGIFAILYGVATLVFWRTHALPIALGAVVGFTTASFYGVMPNTGNGSICWDNSGTCSVVLIWSNIVLGFVSLVGLCAAVGCYVRDLRHYRRLGSPPTIQVP
ncbi:hypothetical protein BJ742DRAFT_795273 [Cladochytrium replicatum]|nr:hypothetical protein BJ742DRAFT_795273 [Cladochytrium replicatum]